MRIEPKLLEEQIASPHFERVSMRRTKFDKVSEKLIAQIILDDEKFGALFQSVTHDATGWDGLVEFDPVDFDGPAERSPPPPSSSYVQVKSSTKAQAAADLTLSNALKMVRSPHPWFVVMVHRSKRGGETILYFRHVWGAFMSDLMKEIRRAELKGEKLHQRRVALSFAKAERVAAEDLVSRMREAVVEVGPDYETEKRWLYNTAGRENGLGTSSFTLAEMSPIELALGGMGLGVDLKVTRFEFTEERFGLRANEPEVELTDATLRIEPNPLCDCEFRFDGGDQSTEFLAPGKVHRSALNHSHIAYINSFLTLLMVDGKPHVRVTIDADTEASFADLDNFIRYCQLAQRGPVECEIWVKGRKALWGNFPQYDYKFAAEPWLRSLSLLRKIDRDGMISMRQIVESRQELQHLDKVLSKESVTLTSKVADMPVGSAPTLVLFYVAAQIGGRHYFVLAQRPVIKDASGEAGRALKLGRAKWVASYSTETPDREQWTKDLMTWGERLAETEVVATVDDLSGAFDRVQQGEVPREFQELIAASEVATPAAIDGVRPA